MSMPRSFSISPRRPLRANRVAVVGGVVLSIIGRLPAEAQGRKEPVRFADDIMPLLAANCTACHNAKLSEGGLSMESFATILKGGDSGPAIAAGKPAESVLFLRAAHREGDAMPPADNKVGARNLTPAELALLERWIAEGAKGSTSVAKPIAWRPLPKGTGGVIAVALSADGSISAAGRGGRLTMFDTHSGGSLATLVDPALAAIGPDLAHADVISAAAFSPVDDLLATGSFRTIKLWRRAGARKLAERAGSTGVAAARSGSLVATPLADGRVAIVDLAAADAPVVQHVGSSGPPAVAVSMSPDGTLIAVADKARSVSIFRVADSAAAGRFISPGDIRSLAFAGAKRLVTSEADGVLRVWDVPVASGDSVAVKPLKEIPEATHPVLGLTGMPPMAGQAAAVVVGACGDGNVRMWNVESGAMVRQFTHGGPVAGVAVSPDGLLVATVGTVPGVKLWRTDDGALVAHAGGDPLLVARLARKDFDVAVLKRDIEHAKAEVAAAEKAKRDAAEAVKKAADNLATAEKTFKEKEKPFLAAKVAREEAEKADAMARNAVTQAEAVVAEATKSVAALPAGVDAAVKAAAERVLAAARQDLGMAQGKAASLPAALAGKVAAERQPAQEFESARVGLVVAKGNVQDVAKEVTLAEEALPTRQANRAAAEASLKAAETERDAIDAELKVSARPFAAVAFSQDGASLYGLDATPSGDAATLAVLGGRDGLPRRMLPVVAKANAIAAAAGRVVVAGGPNAAGFYDLRERWDLVRTIGGEQTPPATDDEPDGPPVDAVLALAFSPDGSTFASGSGRVSRGGEIKFWKTADGSLVRAIPQAHSDTVVALAFSRDGTRLASGGSDRFARIHRVADGIRERSLDAHAGHVLGVAWQPDGRRLVTAGADGVVKVWGVAISGQPQDVGVSTGAERTIKWASREVSGVNFIGEGDEFVASSGDGSVRIISATTGKDVRTLAGARGFVSSLSVAGQVVAAGGQDGRLVVWKATEPQKPLLAVEPAAKD